MEKTVVSIITLVTAIVTYLFGLISKKLELVEGKHIPLQNLCIGIIAGIICYGLKIDGMDLATSLITCLMSALGAGGTYDLTKTKGGQA